MALASKAFSDLITFTRASTAGYYGSDGLYKTAPSGSPRTGAYADYTPAVITQQNLLSYSEQAFDNAIWTKTNAFVQTNLCQWSETHTGHLGAADGTTPPTISATTYAGVDVESIAFASGITGYAVSRRSGSGAGVSGVWTAAVNTTYVASMYIALSRALTAGEVITVYQTGNFGGWDINLTSSTANPTTLQRYVSPAVNMGVASGAEGTYVYSSGVALTSPVTVYITKFQVVQGSVPGDYRATTSTPLPILYADYTGALAAMKVCETTATTAQHYVNQNVSSAPAGTYTYLAEFKAADRTKAMINRTDTGGYSMFFDLSAGTVTSYTGFTSPTITSIGNGWYRVTGVMTIAAVTTIGFGLETVNAIGQAAYTGDGSSGIYVARAQISPSSTALPYLATTSSGATVTSTGSKAGFIVEESRTNLLLRSQDWTATWFTANITITSNAAGITAPDGTTTATKLLATATASTTCFQSATATNTSHTFSVFAKQGSGANDANRFQVYNLTTSTTLANVSLDYSTGVVTHFLGSGVTAQPLPNGWWRLVIPVTSGITVGNSLACYPCFTSPSETAGEFAYVWGSQLEPGAFATSYIPTTTAQVTRANDIGDINTLSPWFNASEGTFYAEFDGGKSVSGIYGRAIGYDGPRAFISANGAGANSISTWNNSVALAASFTGSVLTGVKTASAYSSAGRALVGNAGTVATDANLIGTVTVLRLGSSPTANEYLNGHLRSIRYYPRRLTNAELQALTA